MMTMYTVSTEMRTNTYYSFSSIMHTVPSATFQCTVDSMLNAIQTVACNFPRFYWCSNVVFLPDAIFISSFYIVPNLRKWIDCKYYAMTSIIIILLF